jgi:Zn-dependent peptidase ImmA (M78 family)
MPVKNINIERVAEKLLEKYHINEIPLPVDELAKKMGLSLLAYDLGEDVSGLLHIKDGTATIGYNPNESKVRQRFTIAHEIAHFVLHKEDEKVFIDNGNYYSQIKFRSSKLRLSDKDFKHEIEANSFAAALLMPATAILKEVKNYNGFDLSDSSMITELSKKFEVSMQAMSFRIINLAGIGII